MTRVAKNAIQKLTRELGEGVAQYGDNVLRNIKAEAGSVRRNDEIWCFCYAKDKNLPDEMRGQPGVGSMYTWTTLDVDTKVIISWRFGRPTSHLAVPES